jgi:hypothetical protein
MKYISKYHPITNRIYYVFPSNFEVAKIYYMCSCGKSLLEFDSTDIIDVNIESKGIVQCNNFFKLSFSCKNPLCEWSKIK